MSPAKELLHVPPPKGWVPGGEPAVGDAVMVRWPGSWKQGTVRSYSETLDSWTVELENGGLLDVTESAIATKGESEDE